LGERGPVHRGRRRDPRALHALGHRVREAGDQRIGRGARAGHRGHGQDGAEMPAGPVGEFDREAGLDRVARGRDVQLEEPVRRLRAQVGEHGGRGHGHVTGSQRAEPAADAGAQHQLGAVARRGRGRRRRRRADAADDHRRAHSRGQQGVPLGRYRAHDEDVHVESDTFTTKLHRLPSGVPCRSWATCTMNGLPLFVLAATRNEWLSCTVAGEPTLARSGTASAVTRQPLCTTARGTSMSTVASGLAVTSGNWSAYRWQCAASKQYEDGVIVVENAPVWTVTFGAGLVHADSSSRQASAVSPQPSTRRMALRPVQSTLRGTTLPAWPGRSRHSRNAVARAIARLRSRTRTPTAPTITAATRKPIMPSRSDLLGSATAIAAPTTQASCRNVSERANALDRSDRTRRA